jgi:hypothetical protein
MVLKSYWMAERLAVLRATQVRSLVRPTISAEKCLFLQPCDCIEKYLDTKIAVVKAMVLPHLEAWEDVEYRIQKGFEGFAMVVGSFTFVFLLKRPACCRIYKNK